MKIKEMREIADTELKKMGITVKDINQPIGTLSGGQRSAWRSPGRCTSVPGC